MSQGLNNALNINTNTPSSGSIADDIILSTAPSAISNCALDVPRFPNGYCILEKGVLTDPQIVTLITLLITAFLMYIGWLLVKRKRNQLEQLRRITHYLDAEEIIELQVHAPMFSETIIRRLFIRFMNLDWDRSGTLTCYEFCTMPELQCNPLSYRLFDAFDVNEDGHLDFAEFVGCVHVMSPLCSANDKAAAMFRIYDVDSDGAFLYSFFVFLFRVLFCSCLIN